MVGLVIASHGLLATQLLATARHIVGELTGVATCAVEPGQSLDDIRSNIHLAVKQVDSGDGVIVFADLVGGTPCTQSLSLCHDRRLEVITGVNLPMLLKAVARRTEGVTSLPDLARELVEYGQRNITCASDALRRISAA